MTNRLIPFYLAERFLFLLMTVVPISAPPLTRRSAIRNAIWLLSPVCEDFVSLSTTAFALTVNVAAAVSLVDTIPIVCSPAESVTT